MNQPGRTLPLRVPLAPGEAMDSWLEALARRNQITVRKLTAALGWTVPNHPGGLVAGISGTVLRRIEYQAGLPAGRLDDAVLDRYLPAGAVRCRGSRYCPSCLAERDGRWVLAWRLPWTFACTTHHVLLGDTCPACRQVPRVYTGPAGLNPPGTCPSSLTRDQCCAADLREATSWPLAAGSMVLAAQHWIGALPGLAGGEPGDRAVSVLSDLGIVASWVLRTAPASLFAGYGEEALAAWHKWHEQPPVIRDQPRRAPPSSAALTAALAATGMSMLAGDGAQAIGAIRALLPPGAHPGQMRPAGMPAQHWKQLSGPARGRFLRARDPDLRPADRLRYRTGTPAAGIPAASAAQLAARARMIPQLLWPDWAIRLTPAAGLLPGPLRSTLAACLMLPGNPVPAIGEAITSLHAYRASFVIGAALRSLAENGHGSVLAAISYLAGYLDEYGSPIDYQRRRDLIPPETITADQWRELCLDAAAHPGEARRHRDAQRYLFQLLTSADLNDPRHALAFTSGSDRSLYLGFTDTLTTGLRAALHEHAAVLLGKAGIGEPLTWSPPPDCCASLDLPGPGPGDIDLDTVRQLIITEQLPVGEAAARLGTSTEHVRLALEAVPRPARQWGRNTLPVVRQWQQRARATLTRDFYEREYVQAGKTLRDLEAETGFPRKFLADRAREHGIILASASDHAPINPDWLRGQYLNRQRSYTNIAAELGVHAMTVITAARRFGIPSRPPGVHSRPEMISALSARIPASIRRAVEGRLHGWLRLQRFQAAMAHPTIEAAAAHLGVDQATLIRQFTRLEHDSGSPLYHRSTKRTPLRPTRRGTVLLKALQRPDVAELMRRGAKPPALPRQPRPPRTSTRPPGRQQQSRAFYDAITARKITMTRPARAALRVLLDADGEQLFGEQIAERAGLALGTIYSLLARLAAAGWITSRAEDQKACHDRNRGQPHYRLRIPRTYHLLTPDGRKAALHELSPQAAGSPGAHRSNRPRLVAEESDGSARKRRRQIDENPADAQVSNT